MAAVRQPGEEPNRTRYRAVVANLDRELGRLADALAGTHALLLVIGDNGASPPFERERSGGLRGQKLSLYEGGIRVPFLAWWANRRDLGLVNEQTVIATVDLLPSLAAIAGAALPQGYSGDGQDLSQALGGDRPARATPLYWEYGRNPTSFAYPGDPHHRSPNLALREGPWKLLMQDDGSRLELYQVEDDPGETRDRAADEPARVERMRRLLHDWRRSVP
jgi:arylsulfatase A-like enzyme